MTDITQYNEYVAQGSILVSEIQLFEIKGFNDLDKSNEFLKQCQKLKKDIENKRVEITKPMLDAKALVDNMAKEVSIPVLLAETEIKNKILAWNKKQEEIRQEKEKQVLLCIEQVNICETDEEVNKLSFEIIDTRIDTAIYLKLQEFEKKRQEEIERIEREKENARLEEIRKTQSIEQAKLEQERIELERQKRELEAEQLKIENDKKVMEQTQIPSKDETKAKGIRKITKFEILDETIVPRILCSPDDRKIREFLKNGIKEITGIRIYEEDAVR